MATSTTVNALRHSTSTPTSCRRSGRSSICWPASIAPPWTRRQAGSDRRTCRASGAGLRFGEFALPLVEGFLRAAAPPVSGDRGGPLGVDAALVADIGPQVVHDRLGFAVNEHLYLPRQPAGLLHC